ncbi:MAG: hypothetical protein AAFZ07_14780 [Actinomycetota bacterium]
MRLTDIEDELRAHEIDVELTSIHDLRERRSLLGSFESQISFLRRILQTRIDLIDAALAARDDEPGSEARLMSLLSAIPELVARVRPGASTRSPRSRGLIDPDLELLAEVESDAGIALMDVPAAADDDLRRELARLNRIERSISDLRRRLHGSIDAIQADIARRYRVGELTVSG